MPSTAATPHGTATDSVTVWFADLDAPGCERLTGLLSDDEHARAARFVLGQDRRRFVARRIFRRLVLALRLGVPPEGLRFRTEPGGRPVLDGPSAGTVVFSCSSSAGLALVGVRSGGLLGADLQATQVVPSELEGLLRMLAPEEADHLRRLPAGEQLRAFHETWVRKEAVLKALGEGLARPLASFAVSPGQPTPLRLDPLAPGVLPPALFLSGVRIEPGLARADRDWFAAVATDTPVPVQTRRWPPPGPDQVPQYVQ